MKDKLYTYKVTKIISIHDGDTFKCIIDLGFRLYTKLVVRLIDFDAFEIEHTKKLLKECKTNNVTVEQGHSIGLKIKQELSRILNNSKEIYLQSYAFDSFGRALAIVEADGININQYLTDFQNKLVQEIRNNV